MKTIIFGLDGATFRVLNRYREELPVLDRICREGYSAELNSTYPATTSVAWPAMATGQNPAKFGLADFLYRDPDTMEFHLNDARQRPLDFFWQYMDESIGLGSVPIVPYHDLDGVFIQGSLAHVEEDRVTKPPELEADIPEEFSYAIDWRDGPEALRKTVLDGITARKNVFMRIAREYDLPVYFFVFDAIDRIQHHFWAFMDEDHPNYSPSEYESTILEVWKVVDESMAEILDTFDEPVNVVVASDHGFKPCHTGVNVSALLRREGLLTYDMDRVDSLLTRVADVAKQRLGRRIVTALSPRWLLQWYAESAPSDEGLGSVIDWEKTKAYSFGVTSNIFLNRAGRERDGIVSEAEYERVCEEVATTLESFVDEETGEAPLSVVRKEEIYRGPYIDYVPDLVVSGKEGYKPEADTGDTIISRRDGAMPNSGVHEREGIFAASGPAFTDTERAETPLDIVDVAPTLLHAYDYTVPNDMDGRVVTEALTTDRPVDSGTVEKGERTRVRDRVLSLKQLGKI